MKKLMLTTLIAITMLSVVACGKKLPEGVMPSEDPGVKVEDKESSDMIMNDKSIESANVYVKDRTVFAALIIKEGVDEEKAKELAEEYAEDLKEIYDELNINLQAIQKGGNVVNIEK